MKELLTQIRACDICSPHLIDGVNPVLTAHKNSKIAIIGQAPGIRVHKSSVPWDDPSGVRLREWLGIDETVFYDPKIIAIIPMGFCYPGKGKTGDLPPRKECAPMWHGKLFEKIKNIELTLLIGMYAQTYYLGSDRKKTLTETVLHYEEYLPEFLPLPHPSPRNNIWLKKNQWFEKDVVPLMRKKVQKFL